MGFRVNESLSKPIDNEIINQKEAGLRWGIFDRLIQSQP